MPLKHWEDPRLVVAGTDEAGRGCLAGPVTAAAVILPADYRNDRLNDSKQLSARQREDLRRDIERNALTWAVTHIEPERIDSINILWAAVEAMQASVRKLNAKPDLLLVDGNRFRAFDRIPHRCIVKGDATYYCIAAASIIAKTERDRLMEELSTRYPQYNWAKNKGYPTADHRAAIAAYGPTPLHRRSFRLLADQTALCFPQEGQNRQEPSDIR